MTIKGFTVREWINRAAPVILLALAGSAIGLYVKQFTDAIEDSEMRKDIEELQRQNTRQWEAIDDNKQGEEIAALQQWKTDMTPLIQKGAGL
jgi:hypothetical protein